MEGAGLTCDVDGSGCGRILCNENAGVLEAVEVFVDVCTCYNVKVTLTGQS